MTRRILVAAALPLSLALAAPLPSQTARVTGAAPAPVGTVEFENSGAVGAQADFRHGLAQLHNFEYEDAAAAFRRAREQDPSFAMAYWGEAMTHNHPIWMEQDRAAAVAVLEAGRRAGAAAPTEREKAYLATLDVLYGDGDKDKEERDRGYAATMGALYRRFPDDEDAAAFYALSLLGTAHGGRDFPTFMRAAAVLEEAWPRHPDHPGLAHYLIHSYDDSIHAPLGLRAARVYSRIAPGAAHAQHMTSHIFLALGMWPETVAANEAAVAAMNEGRRAHGRHARGCGHYAAWLHYAHLQLGREGEARRVLDGCRAEVGPGGQATGDGPLDPDRSSAGSYAAMWLRHLLDAPGERAEVARWEPPATELAGPRLTFAFARLWLAAQRGDAAAARAALERVRQGSEAVEKVHREGRDPDTSHLQRARILVVQSEALVARLEGRGDEALRRAEEAARLEDALPYAFGPPLVDKPSHELLGEMLLAAGDPAAAARAFERALVRAPGRRQSAEGARSLSR